MSEGYSSLRAQWESRMKESEAQSALASASPGAGDRKKPSSTGGVPPWKKSAQAAAAKAKAKESDGAGSLAAPSLADDTGAAATMPSWTRPSLTTHHAAETVEKYVASPSSIDEASPTAAASANAGGGGQAEIVEEHSLSVSAAKSMFGGSVAKSRSSYGGGTGIGGANSNDRAARWKAEAAATSAATVDDYDDNVEEDRITSITVTDAKSMFDRPPPSSSAAASTSTSDAPSSRPKWLTGGGISGSPPSASTGSGVPEAYAELFGVAHAYDKEKGTALGASGIIAEDGEEESGESASGGGDEGGRPAWLEGQSESGEDEDDEEDKEAPEPAVAVWLQAENQKEDLPSDQHEAIASVKKDEFDEPPPKKRGWGTNLMKWLERKESESGSGSDGNDKGGTGSQDQPEPMHEETLMHGGDGDAVASGAYDDDAIIEPSEDGEEEVGEGTRRKQTEEEEAILAMMEAENQRYDQGQETAAAHRATHDINEDGEEIREMETFEHDGDASDENNTQEDPDDNIATAVVGAAFAGAGIAAATVATTSPPPLQPDGAEPIEDASSPIPSVDDEAEVGATYEETYDDYAGGYDETEYYSEEEGADYIEQTEKAPSSVPSARELRDEDYDEYMGNDESYSDRSTEGLEANLSSAYGLGAADNDDYYHNQDEYDEDDYMEDLDDDTVQDLETSHDREEGDANKSYTTVDKLEEEFLTETGERSSQGRVIEEGENATAEDAVGRERPALYPEDSEVSLDNTTLADERSRLRQELEMEILQEEEDDEESPTEAQVATVDHTSVASSSDDGSEDNTALKAAAVGLAAAAVAGGAAGAVAATRAPDDIPPPAAFSDDQDYAETGYDEILADTPSEYEEQTYRTAVASADFTDEADGHFDEAPNEEGPKTNEEESINDEAALDAGDAGESLGNYESSENGTDAKNSYADEDAANPEEEEEYANDEAADYYDESAPQNEGEDWGEEEHYADDDYPLYPHPSTDANEDIGGDKLYDYEDADSGYSNKVETAGVDFSGSESDREGAAGDQIIEGGYNETYPDDDEPPDVQEEPMFEESMNSEALNARAILMREELTDEIDREKQGQGIIDEGHASAESYDYYNEPESKRELKARIDSIHSEVVEEDEGIGRETGDALASGAAISSNDCHDQISGEEESVQSESDDDSGDGREGMAMAGAAALAAAVTAGGIAAAAAEEEVQVPTASASEEDKYAPRASQVSHGEETHLTWGESDLNAPEPPAQHNEAGGASGNYPEEKEEEIGYDEYGDYYEDEDADYNDGNVIAMDMEAPIDFSNPPPEPSSDDPYNDDGNGPSNEDDGYYRDQTGHDGYYQEEDLKDDYYQSNEFSQDHHQQEGEYVARENEWNESESGQDQGAYENEDDQENKAAYAAGGLVAAAALGGGIAAVASTGDADVPSNSAVPVAGPDKEPGDYGPKARSPSIRLKKSVVDEQRPRERLPMDAIVESESFPEVERDIELGYDEGFLPDEHLHNSAEPPKGSTSASATKRVSWDKDIDRERPSNMKKWCILAVIIVALGGIALGVSFSLSKRNNSSSDTQNTQDSRPGSKDTSSTSPQERDDTHEHPEIIFTQVGERIDGPSRTFEYGPGTNGEFGSSLSLSGDGTRVAIGAPNYSASIFSQGERLGLVQVFEQQNGTWAKLEPDIFGDFSGDATGTSVSLSSDGMTLAVGSPEHLDAIFGGQVILYQFTDDGVWQQIGSPIIGDDAFDRLGTSVSLSDKGDRVVISQPTNKAGGAARKVAKVYELQNNDWVQLGDDLVGRFGSDPVSMSGDGQVVALGSLSRSENDNRAAIRTYHYVNETGTNDTVGWKLKGSEIELEGARRSSYDTLWMPSLSADGNTLAIGSAIENFNRTENSNEQQELQVLAYRFDEELGDWVEIPVNTNLDMQGLGLDRYSTSLSGDGHELVVGDSSAGVVEILHLSDEGAYMPVGGNIEVKGEDDSDDMFGYSVAVSSDGIYLASGAPKSVVAGEEVGSVSVFQMEITEHH